MTGVAKQLKRGLRRRGVFQREVAQRMGISEVQMSRLVRPRNMTLASLADMATAMDFDVEVRLKSCN